MVGTLFPVRQSRIATTRSKRWLAFWFDVVGLSLNASKSKVVGFGFYPNPITINGVTILPSKSFKFLDLTIQSDLKLNIHVENLDQNRRTEPKL